jgi:hypothetical protein
VWCQLLQFYAAWVAGKQDGIDSLFARVTANELAQLGPSWVSVQALLDSADAEQYTRLPKNEQIHVDSQLWWLATPFLAEAEHSRKAAHYARMIRNQLNRGLPLEAQHDLRIDRGADALLVARVRYGFPEHQLWMGPREEAEHFRFLKGWHTGPYSAMEYSRDNAAVVPSLSLALDPLGMHERSVLLSAPRDATIDTWWPHEFFLHPRGRIVPLPTSQRVLLRRDSAALLVAATVIGGGALNVPGGQSVRVVLSHSPGPEAVTHMVSLAARKGDRVVLQQLIQRPGLVGLEVLVDSGGVAGARSRVGLRGVPTLAALGSTTCGLSDPVLGLAEDSTEPFAAMLGSTDLERPTSVGVAWESYGFPQGDTVTIAVRIASTEALSNLRRAGMALRLADDPRVNVMMQWREPNPTRAGTTVAASRPILYRHVALDIRQLRTGSYGVEIEMSSATCGTVRATRALSVAR